MRSKLWVALALGLLVVASEVGADEQQDAKSILQKAVQAAGGMEKLSEYPAMTWNDEGKFYGMGAGGADYTGEYAIEFPNKFRMEIKDIFTMVLNGDEGWVSMGGVGVTPMTAEQVTETKEQVHAAYVSSLVPLMEKDYRLTKLDPIEIDGKPAVGIQASREGHRDVKLYFDEKTYLLAKLEYPVKAEELGGKEVIQEEFFWDYKQVSGVPAPTKMRTLRDGEKFIESELSDFKVAKKLPEDTFQKP